MKRFPLLALAAIAAIASIPATAFAQQVRLRIGHDQPAGTMYDEGHAMFRKLVEERSGGRIKVDVFPAAQLGSWSSPTFSRSSTTFHASTRASSACAPLLRD
jgi:TRAP-type C4-dicarboxylate transport system substrate-binding protein